jgi:hypothetical protein
MTVSAEQLLVTSLLVGLEGWGVQLGHPTQIHDEDGMFFVSFGLEDGALHVWVDPKGLNMERTDASGAITHRVLGAWLPFDAAVHLAFTFI